MKNVILDRDFIDVTLVTLDEHLIGHHIDPNFETNKQNNKQTITMPAFTCPWCSFSMLVDDEQMTTFKAHLLRRHQVKQ